MQQMMNDWDSYLSKEFQKEYYQQLQDYLLREYETEIIYPKREDIFNAFLVTSYTKTKVVLLGQDPYHGPNQAHGFSFSVKQGVTIPPSLRNIYKELHNDLGISIPNHGYLLDWAKEGVLLLNTVLTVRAHEANSHRGIGWEVFTDQVMKCLNAREKPIVFILWGRQAQAKKAMIDCEKHFVLEAPHPSPLSAHRGFFGSKPFSKTNTFLESIGESPIDWSLK
ncbi:uracil-DNA glycosylase [Salirhabdus sp. Marseille-P4669]|uniref:uracil-DNA glycosylase n=1 Tax=Salirhabdus sp. Marseille-P4669 TaxID=2042310 RepID=UPI000C7C44BE|nr:uracil-DNA glycosylase [Salirhabdus sp. Marseille-P4669]